MRLLSKLGTGLGTGQMDQDLHTVRLDFSALLPA